MSKRTEETPTLEQKISAALVDADIASADLSALVSASEAAIVAAERMAAAAKQKALDPALSPDPKVARATMEDAQFAATRLRTLLPRLQQRLAEVAAAEELAQWEAERARVQAMVEAAAEKFAAQYPKLVAELVELFRLAEEVDEEVRRVNGSAPTGAHARLRGVELVARDLDGFSRDQPQITKTVRLPDWQRSSDDLWPPRQPIDPRLFAPVQTDPRTTFDWETAWAERRQAEQERQEQEALKAAAAREDFWGRRPPAA